MPPTRTPYIHVQYCGFVDHIRIVYNTTYVMTAGVKRNKKDFWNPPVLSDKAAFWNPVSSEFRNPREFPFLQERAVRLMEGLWGYLNGMVWPGMEGVGVSPLPARTTVWGKEGGVSPKIWVSINRRPV